MKQLDPHEAAPDAIKILYKRYQRLALEEIDADPQILDFKRCSGIECVHLLEPTFLIPGVSIERACECLCLRQNGKDHSSQAVQAYGVKNIPGEWYAQSEPIALTI